MIAAKRIALQLIMTTKTIILIGTICPILVAPCASKGQSDVPCGISSMIVDLRHDINFPPEQNLRGLKRLEGGDEGAPRGKGFTWSMLTIPVRPPDQVKLPEGIVFGLKHSMHQAKADDIKVLGYEPVKGPSAMHGFRKEIGGDWNAPKGQGFYWYETTGEGFTDDDWATIDSLNLLPKGTVIGLKNSRNQPTKKLTWKGKVYDAADKSITPPDGFSRRFGGDLGLPAGQGFFWYEKTVGCDPAGKARGGE